MPITVQQAWQNVDLSLENGSGENSDSRATVYYIVSGTTSDADACLEAWAHSDEIFHAMPRKSVSVNERLTDDTWKIEVIYGNDISNSSNSDVEGEPQLSFDCSSSSKHIVRSLNQKKLYPSPDPGGMIGWNGKTGSDADFAGVDVGTATMRETYTKQMRSADLTTAYRRTIANLTNTVNSTSFMGWEAGEVMFLGASFSGSLSGEFITVTFNFAIQQNERNVEVAEGLRVNKRGWEYIWTITETVSEGENKAPRVKIINAIVDQVYRYEDFGKLKL